MLPIKFEGSRIAKKREIIFLVFDTNAYIFPQMVARFYKQIYGKTKS